MARSITRSTSVVALGREVAEGADIAGRRCCCLVVGGALHTDSGSSIASHTGDVTESTGGVSLRGELAGSTGHTDCPCLLVVDGALETGGRSPMAAHAGNITGGTAGVSLRTEGADGADDTG